MKSGYFISKSIYTRCQAIGPGRDWLVTSWLYRGPHNYCYHRVGAFLKSMGGYAAKLNKHRLKSFIHNQCLKKKENTKDFSYSYLFLFFVRSNFKQSFQKVKTNKNENNMKLTYLLSNMSNREHIQPKPQNMNA